MRWKATAKEREEIISGQERVIAAAQAELVLACQRTTVAESEVKEAIIRLDVAQCSLQLLSHETGRQAWSFKEADLQADLFAALERIEDLELAHAAQLMTLTTAKEALEISLSSANSRNVELEDALRDCHEEIAKLQELEKSWIARCESLSVKAGAACEVHTSLATKVQCSTNRKAETLCAVNCLPVSRW